MVSFTAVCPFEHCLQLLFIYIAVYIIYVCRLIPFPKERLLKEAWLKQFNRTEEHNSETLLQPKRFQRVCSVHFVDGQPSHENPLPELLLVQDKKRSVSGKKRIQADSDRCPGTRAKKTPARSSCNPDASSFPSPSSVAINFETVTKDASTLLTVTKFILCVLISLFESIRQDVANRRVELHFLRMESQ